MKVALNPAELRLIVNALDDKHQFQLQSGGGEGRRGWKNWIHLGSKEAGPRVAAIISVVETCRRLKIPVRAYLASALPGLDDFPISRIAELTPTAWAARN